MSRSIKKEKWFGNASRSEKLDKRINNRMFRKHEKMSIRKGEEPPIDMDEIRNIWAMAKDGKSYWRNATKKDMSK
jgi:hypothetical protein